MERAAGRYFYICHLDYEHALEHLALALRAKPGDSATIELTGYVQRRQGRMKEAAEALTHALELNPNRSRIAFNLGETHCLLRDFRLAEENFNRALSISPDYGRAYAYKVRSRFRLRNDIDGARIVMRQAQSAGVNTDGWVLHQGILMENSASDYAAALKLLDLVRVELYGEQFWYVPRPLTEARIRELLKQPVQARRLYDSARILPEQKVREDPEDPRYHSSLGIALAGLGRKQEAIREGKKAVELMPVSREAYRGAYRLEDLAHIYAMVGEEEAAIDQLAYLMSIPTDLGVAALQLDRAWSRLRSHPRFQVLLRQHNP